MVKTFTGEFIGTSVLVFLGCSTVAIAVLFGLTLWQVSILWGLAVFLGIVSSVKLCSAHLNPAVSLAMLIQKRISIKEYCNFVLGQFCGAIIAGFFVYLCFSSSIEYYETTHSIIRGSKASVNTAMIFGEFFPNPGNNPQITVAPSFAFAVEAIAGFILVTIILLVDPLSIAAWQKYLLISITVSLLIFFGAKYTQVGINPARDFGPRLIAYFCGWKTHAFPPAKFSFFYVYILAPCVGSSLAALLLKQKGVNSH